MRVLVTGGSGFIGTRTVDHLLRDGADVLNVDRAAPNKEEHRPHWRPCDILDVEPVLEAFADFAPTHVVHLAARVDTDSPRLNDYRVNTDGTANVLEAIDATPGIERVVVTSTQFVCTPGHPPTHDQEFNPHTAYGQSKVRTEQLTRAADLTPVWTIIRPTNVWGPWHPRYPSQFWRVLRDGRYVHPDSPEPVLRSYGYVGNVVYQIGEILTAPVEQVDRKVYYVGDRPIELLDYVNGFSRAITGQNVRVVPRGVIRALALAGDLLTALGVAFPLQSSRFRSMTEDDPTPMEPTMEAFGEPPYSMEDGIRETTQWLRRQGFFST